MSRCCWRCKTKIQPTERNVSICIDGIERSVCQKCDNQLNMIIHRFINGESGAFTEPGFVPIKKTYP